MNTIVGLPFDEELARFIGKKGSENSITFYNRKMGNDVIVALQPNMERFYSLLEVLTISDQVVVSTKSIDKALGEVIIALSLLEKSAIFTDDNSVDDLLKGLKIKYRIASRASLIEAILEARRGMGASASNGARIDIDKAFNVKGVGTVVLGIVTKGVVRVHDTLYHSSGKSIIVRSIQSQDEDIEEAGEGTRIGIAIKGMEYDEIEKGDILASRQIPSAKSISIEISKSPLVGEQMEQGNLYGIGCNFSYSKAFVESIDKNLARLKLEKPLPIEAGEVCLLERQAVPRIFASGKVITNE
ncbi:MAG: EF-Tu/IF-2/RF-3 family GTPase [Candidatus Micrarchaeia archaeon]